MQPWKQFRCTAMQRDDFPCVRACVCYKGILVVVFKAGFVGRRGLNVHICWELEIETYLQSLCTCTQPMCLTWNRNPFSLTISSRLPGLKPYWIWARRCLLQSSADKLGQERPRSGTREVCGAGWKRNGRKERDGKSDWISCSMCDYSLSHHLFLPPPTSMSAVHD